MFLIIIGGVHIHILEEMNCTCKFIVYILLPSCFHLLKYRITVLFMFKYQVVSVYTILSSMYLFQKKHDGENFFLFKQKVLLHWMFVKWDYIV